MWEMGALPEIGRRGWTSLILAWRRTRPTRTPDPLTYRHSSSCADGPRFVVTKRGLAPEIAHFRTPNEPHWVSQVVSGEWYIKGIQCVTYPSPAVLGPSINDMSRNGPPPLDARYILRYV